VVGGTSADQFMQLRGAAEGALPSTGITAMMKDIGRQCNPDDSSLPADHPQITRLAGISIWRWP
jgi:hypothetical protein